MALPGKWRNLALLSLINGFVFTAIIANVTMTARAVIGLDTVSLSYITIPIAFTFLGQCGSCIPLNMLTKRKGFKAAFLVGNSCGLASSLLMFTGLESRTFWLFAFSAMLLGVSATAGLLTRFAAQSPCICESEFRSTAVSLTILGPVVGAAAGPWIAAGGRDIPVTGPLARPYALSYLLLTIPFVMNLILASFLTIDDLARVAAEASQDAAASKTEMKMKSQVGGVAVEGEGEGEEAVPSGVVVPEDADHLQVENVGRGGKEEGEHMERNRRSLGAVEEGTLVRRSSAETREKKTGEVHPSHSAATAAAPHSSSSSAPQSPWKYAHDVLFINPAGRLAIVAGTVGYAAMTVGMAPAPADMANLGYSDLAITGALQSHFVLMFLPGFFTGFLAKSIGLRVTILLGDFATLFGFLLLMTADPLSLWVPWLGLAVLGVGWNWMFVGASALVVGAVSERDKIFHVLGLNDTILFFSTACLGVSAGILLGNSGRLAQLSLGLALASLGLLYSLFDLLVLPSFIRAKEEAAQGSSSVRVSSK
uniref:Major facilitator superfamily (MFS) profile domain-containing protein n=1 Tax=Chromera velia CCMP2878 TaxID=1169474 RepID=A0A0G4F701_9ALVE|eukprot:Cvel_15530.t1-p1 / transcript=Cvel_15530.t1 / gene=Cvel_15530 / organism=Chromera_velia_CCMP2878 / gene_product=hypothetical protein / transcript_product=hypothetical protein / location=Cvel_scaffold1153:42618-45589(+) / protein_length=536 / sequence_SO=supercontig / SO=protein_coding / is_pseudo=false